MNSDKYFIVLCLLRNSLWKLTDGFNDEKENQLLKLADVINDLIQNPDINKYDLEDKLINVLYGGWDKLTIESMIKVIQEG
jgi:hypothetical protein